MRDSPARQFLFLQGLPGDFFARLARRLTALGCGVHRINFNGGDLVDWPLPNGVNFRGRPDGWPPFLARFLRAHAITDIVLFGDCRPQHRAARAAAEGLGIQVHVFEEGYLRPDWVTLERGGVNGFSPLPTDPAWYRATARRLPPLTPAPPLPSSVRGRVTATLRYYAAAALHAWSFPHYRTHRPWPAWVEAYGWALRGARRLAAPGAVDAARLRRQGPYVLLPLQLDSDYQLRSHSDFEAMLPALTLAVASFAAHAPANLRLVVKAHPLDNGLRDWRRLTLACAAAFGAAERVVFVGHGDITDLVRASDGIITVNSTTGALALAAGRPVFVLGRAVYDLPGLTHQGPLSSFWSRREAPDPELYDAFQRVLADRCLLRGGFYHAASGPALVAAAAARMLRPMPVPVRLLQRRETSEPPVRAVAL
jgi:capsular polysaccharide export protein